MSKKRKRKSAEDIQLSARFTRPKVGYGSPGVVERPSMLNQPTAKDLKYWSKKAGKV